jgi:GT2 family glycosyltransferase
MSEFLLLIVLQANGEHVAGVERYQGNQISNINPESRVLSQEFARLVDVYPDAYIVWYDICIEPYIADITSWPALIHHPLEVLHLSVFQGCYHMAVSLGFVDFDSPFLIPGPTDRRFVTWLISSMAGIGLARTFKAIGYEPVAHSFAASLFDFGQRGAKWGLCPYSEPALLKKPLPESVTSEICNPLSSRELAVLVRSLYGRKWLAFWLLAQLIYQRRFPALAAAIAWFRRQPPPVDEAALQALHPPLPEVFDNSHTVDVIIPTLGRPQHALNVLRDLTAQRILPNRVILIEQHPDSDFSDLLAKSLDEEWPFEIRHYTVPWVGACRARNLGLGETEADWVLLLDDDVRLDDGFIQYLLKTALAYQVDVITSAVFRTGQNMPQSNNYPRLWAAFGSGVSLVSASAARNIGGFDLRLEGGFGEDYEYGVRLRLSGANVLFAPGKPVLHLKAPVGGFRFEYPHLWKDSRIQPKPSPTVLYSRQKYGTQAMQDGYKLYYWLNRLSALPFWLWMKELWVLNRGWNSAQKWAQYLADTHEP